MRSSIRCETEGLSSWIEIKSDDVRNPIDIVQPGNTITAGFVRMVCGGLLGLQPGVAGNRYVVNGLPAVLGGSSLNTQQQVHEFFGSGNQFGNTAASPVPTIVAGVQNGMQMLSVTSGGVGLGSFLAPTHRDNMSRLEMYSEFDEANDLIRVVGKFQNVGASVINGVVMTLSTVGNIANGNNYSSSTAFGTGTPGTGLASNATTNYFTNHRPMLAFEELPNITVEPQQIIFLSFIIRIDDVFNHNLKEWLMNLMGNHNSYMVNKADYRPMWRTLHTDGVTGITHEGVVPLAQTLRVNYPKETSRNVFLVGYSDQEESRLGDYSVIEPAVMTNYEDTSVTLGNYVAPAGGDEGYYEITFRGFIHNVGNLAQTYREIALFRPYSVGANSSVWGLSHRQVLEDGGMTLQPDERGYIDVVFRMSIIHHDALRLSVTSNRPLASRTSDGLFFKGQRVTINAVAVSDEKFVGVTITTGINGSFMDSSDYIVTGVGTGSIQVVIRDMPGERVNVGFETSN
jgi:hypothetical protein